MSKVSSCKLLPYMWVASKGIDIMIKLDVRLKDSSKIQYIPL